MKIIKTREELLKLLDSNKDLISDDDVTIEFSTSKEDVRNVRCFNLSMVKEAARYDLNISGNFTGGNFTGGNFNGGDFNGGNFNGGDFNGWNFTGRDFNGGDFNGRDFNGRNFNGGDITYYAFFCCYGEIIKSGKITARYLKAAKPIELGKD